MHARVRAGAGVGVARAVGALALTVVLVAACGTTKDKDEAASTTSTTKATTTTAGGSATTTTAGGGSPSAVAAWEKDAQEHRGKDGKRFTYECPAGGTASTIWGTELYTDDSSVCTAAVQVGLITLAKGGTVEIETAPGDDSYAGGLAHGITSKDYGAWDGSFFFPAAAPGTGDFEVSPESWSKTATDVKGGTGTEASIRCSPGGTPGSVWGSGPYTDDSSVCTAAVHSGLITVAEGGTVQIVIGGGKDSFKGSTAHGITTNDYGSYPRSYTFPADQPLQ